jgi:hypothetical protein
MGVANKTIENSKILIVEGKDEAGFIAALIRHLGLSLPQIVQIDGKDKFKRDFMPFWYSGDNSNVNSLGVVMDAEKNQAASTHKSICSVFEKLGIPKPSSPGVLVTTEKIKVGTFIMPDNESAGMLESLCLASITSDPVIDCLNKYFDCFMTMRSAEEVVKINMPKSRLLAYLATKSPYANSIDIAAQKGHFNFENEVFNPLKSFIIDLLS